MESRSHTETKSFKAPQWLIWLLLLVCLLPTVFFMYTDTYRTGDEIITYGMANEPEQGWMFSKGRIRTYLDTEIFGDGIGSVPGNVIKAAGDVLRNKKQAAFFQMERPSETGWYTGEQMRDYLAITEGEAFRPGQIYLNGMGDDANSFLYYLLLHLVSSILPGISAGKWTGFLLNLICMAGALILLERIAAYFVEKKETRILILLAYACSSAAVGVFTNIRPYALTLVLQEALLLAHLKMLYMLQRNGVSVAKKYIKRLIPLYVLGYVAHYTTGIWAVCLALYTLVNAKGEKEFARSYLTTGILAVFLGICVDPMSVLGLLSKLKGTGSSGLVSIYAEMFKAFVKGVFGNVLWLIPTAILCGIAYYRYRKAEVMLQIRQQMLFLGLVVFYMLFSTLLMKGHKINTVLPYCFVLLGMLIPYAAGERKRWKDIVSALCFLLWGIGMFAGLLQEKKDERKDYLLLEEQMAQQEKDSIVFLRDHGAGYDKIPLLGEYERIFLWTADEGWTDRADEASQALQDGGLLLIDGDPQELWTEAEAAGLADGAEVEVLLENEQFRLVRIER